VIQTLLTVEARSPLALHLRRSTEQFAPTLDYIPGSAMLGAVADLYLAGDPARAADPMFERLFLSGDVEFSDLLPAPPASGELARLLPSTAVACKRFHEHRERSLSDSLLRLALLAEVEDYNKAMEMYRQWLRCPECAARDLEGRRDRLEPGYFSGLASYRPLRVRRRMTSGVAICRATGTAAHSMLFSHEVIEESDDPDPVRFRGTVTVPDQEIRRALQQLLPLRRWLAVGYGRSRGWGHLQVSGWDTPRADPEPLVKRWERLNEVAGKLWQSVDRAPSGSWFSLTLKSHLAAKDEAWQPVLEIDPKRAGLVRALGLPDNVEPARSLLLGATVAGWNAAMGCPKADTLAIGRGSVLLFHIAQGEDPAPVLASLQDLEEQGAGERRMEGFGRITACDAFHYHFTQRELEGRR
jgi:CRISPR-associated protein Csx10